MSIRSFFLFPDIDGLSFFLYNLLENVNFWKVSNMQFFPRIVLTYWQELGEKYMFLVKIASKGILVDNRTPGLGSTGF